MVQGPDRTQPSSRSFRSVNRRSPSWAVGVRAEHRQRGDPPDASRPPPSALRSSDDEPVAHIRFDGLLIASHRLRHRHLDLDARGEGDVTLEALAVPARPRVTFALTRCPWLGRFSLRVTLGVTSLQTMGGVRNTRSRHDAPEVP